VWAASLAMKSGITLVRFRWDHERFFMIPAHVPDKTYWQDGAFLDFHISAAGTGMYPP